MSRLVQFFEIWATHLGIRESGLLRIIDPGIETVIDLAGASVISVRPAEACAGAAPTSAVLRLVAQETTVVRTEPPTAAAHIAVLCAAVGELLGSLAHFSRSLRNAVSSSGVLTWGVDSPLAFPGYAFATTRQMTAIITTMTTAIQGKAPLGASFFPSSMRLYFFIKAHNIFGHVLNSARL